MRGSWFGCRDEKTTDLSLSGERSNGLSPVYAGGAIEYAAGMSGIESVTSDEIVSRPLSWACPRRRIIRVYQTWRWNLSTQSTSILLT